MLEIDVIYYLIIYKNFVEREFNKCKNILNIFLAHNKFNKIYYKYPLLNKEDIPRET